MMELSGFLISWEIVELIKVSSWASALEVSYNIFWEMSIKHTIYLSLSSSDVLIKLFLHWKNLNLGMNSSSMFLMH